MEERIYDLIFICRPATPEDEIAKIVTTLDIISAGRATRKEKKFYEEG